MPPHTWKPSFAKARKSSSLAADNIGRVRRLYFSPDAAAKVHILVRSQGLADSMSRYLIRRIEDSPNITLHTYTQITALDGNDRLERVTWRNSSSDRTESRAIEHVFS